MGKIIIANITWSSTNWNGWDPHDKVKSGHRYVLDGGEPHECNNFNFNMEYNTDNRVYGFIQFNKLPNINEDEINNLIIFYSDGKIVGFYGKAGFIREQWDGPKRKETNNMNIFGDRSLSFVLKNKIDKVIERGFLEDKQRVGQIGFNYIKNPQTAIDILAEALILNVDQKEEIQRLIKFVRENFSVILNHEDHLIDSLGYNLPIGFPKNIILYGPPGTGKTYSTKRKALQIIAGNENVNENNFDELYEKYKSQILFTTFHQSYSYEQFVEGISVLTEDGNVVYEVRHGIFQQLCTICNSFKFKLLDFMVELNHKKFENLKTFQGEKFTISVNFNKDILVQQEIDKNQFNIVFELDKILNRFEENEATNIWEYNQFLDAIIDKVEVSHPKVKSRFVLIIDEINRGNISKIFGELITLIEDDKRLGEVNEILVTLPYSGEQFGVPPNLYIIGTMNTADRSLVQLDTALRRRFDFEEMMPCYDESIWINENKTGYDLLKFLEMINEKITKEYDREHQIGHSFLMNVKSIDELKRAWENRIMPLLQEYFYSDYGQLSNVIGKDSEYLRNLDKDNDKWQLNMKVENFSSEFKKVYDFVIENKNSGKDFLIETNNL